MTDTLRAIKDLLDDNITIACLTDNVAHKFNKDPFEVLICNYASKNNNFYQSVVATKVLTKASAILLALSDADEIYAHSITQSALLLVMQNKIPCYFSRIVKADDEYEKLLENEMDLKKAYEIIKQKYIEDYKKS